MHGDGAPLIGLVRTVRGSWQGVFIISKVFSGGMYASGTLLQCCSCLLPRAVRFVNVMPPEEGSISSASLRGRRRSHHACLTCRSAAFANRNSFLFVMGLLADACSRRIGEKRRGARVRSRRARVASGCLSHALTLR